jgi:hypothetical protein
LDYFHDYGIKRAGSGNESEQTKNSHTRRHIIRVLFYRDGKSGKGVGLWGLWRLNPN